MEELNEYSVMIWDLILEYGPPLLLAIVTLVIGLWVIKGMTRGMRKLFEKRDLEASLRPFLLGMFNILLKALLVISVMGMIGIEMTSFIAILGAAGLAIGMALSGTLQNFAGGVMILVFKPYKVGDFIEAQGYSGSVKAIQIFNTILTTPDNKTIIIPNGGLSNSSLINYSTAPRRRVDFTFGIGYSDDIDKAKAVLLELANENKNVLDDPAPFVAVSALADSSVNFTLRVWVESENYWNVFFNLNEKVKKRFDADGISIPFPQRDVHIYNEK